MTHEGKLFKGVEAVENIKRKGSEKAERFRVAITQKYIYVAPSATYFILIFPLRVTNFFCHSTLIVLRVFLKLCGNVYVYQGNIV